MTFLKTDPNYQLPDEKFVMTTWHEAESVEEVTEFLALNTSFDNFLAKNFLLLFVGSDEELQSRALATVRNLLRATAA